MGRFAQKISGPVDVPEPSKFSERIRPSGTPLEKIKEAADPGLAERLGEGVDVAAEALGLPAAERVLKSMGKRVVSKPGQMGPEDEISPWDALQLGLLVGAGGLMKGGGMTLRQILKSFGAGALGAGAGQAALGPEARKASEAILAGGGEAPSLPRRAAAKVVEAAPSFAGGLAAPAGAAKVGTMARGGLPPIKMVPPGDEARAIMQLAFEHFGVPENIAKLPVKTSGEIREAMSQARELAGQPVGAAKKAAYEAATPPKNLKAQIRKALDVSLREAGAPVTKKGKVVPSLVQGGKEVSALKRMDVPYIENLEAARALQTKLAKAAEAAKSKASPTHPQAKTLGSAERAMDELIKSFIPSKPLASLEEANEMAKAFYALDELMNKASRKGGFSPERFADEWNFMKTSEKASKLNPQQIKAIDLLVSEPKPGILKRLSNWASGTVRLIGSRSMGMKGPIVSRALEQSAKGPKRFYRPLPTYKGPIVPAVALGQTVPPIARKEEESEEVKALRKAKNKK